MKKIKILNFIKTYCTEIEKDEDSGYVELMMYDHKCILYNKKEYYILKDSILFTEEDENIKDYLINTYGIS